MDCLAVRTRLNDTAEGSCDEEQERGRGGSLGSYTSLGGEVSSVHV